MNTLIDRLASLNNNTSFSKNLAEALIETGYGHIRTDHIVAAYLLECDSTPHKHLLANQLQPGELSKIILDNIPRPDVPDLPPKELALGTLEPVLQAHCSQPCSQFDGQFLIDHLSESVKFILQIGGTIEPLRQAFSDFASSESKPSKQQQSGPQVFLADSQLNREIFTESSLNLIDAIEETATQLGHDSISLPIIFVALAGTGIFKQYLTGFATDAAPRLITLRAALGRGSLDEPIRFSSTTLTPPVLKFVEQIATTAVDEESDLITEPLLICAFCDTRSAILDSYWEQLGVGREDTRRMISLMTDDSRINPTAHDDTPNVEELCTNLRELIIGQETAIDRLKPVLRRWAMHDRTEDRCSGVLLFMGPTGVGKTELARELANILYGNRKQLCFIEMSQMTEQHSISRLIGSPPGYVGESTGILTSWIAANPESIILFDEVEKAHPKCFDVMLRLLNEGVIQDAAGNDYDAQGTLVILTSNIGQKEGFFDWMSKPGADLDLADPLTNPQIRTLLLKYFRPEFIGRLNDIVVFRPLDIDDYKQIAKRTLQTLVDKFSTQRQLEITIDPSVYDHLANETIKRSQGARGVVSLVQQDINDQILDHLSQKPGSSCLEVTGNADGVNIHG